jgi:fused signal recognition particle receptor
MVSRQATVPAPWVDRPRPAPEPVVLREPEPLIVAPVVETFTAAEPEPDLVAAALELSIVPEPATEPVTLPEPPEVPFRPFAVDAIPSMVPAHVATATTPFGERVSFKDLATALLGETTAEPRALKAVSEPIALEPIVVEPIVAPLELVLESGLVETIEAPQPLVQSPALDEIVALAARPPVEPVAPVIESPRPPALTLETVGAVPAPAPAAREREVAEPAKPAAPPPPQGFEGLKFPNDGVLTRQWMEFLSQMSASK